MRINRNYYKHLRDKGTIAVLLFIVAVLMLWFAGCDSSGGGKSDSGGGGGDTIAPEYVSSVIENSAKDRVVITFSRQVTSSEAGYTVEFNGTEQNITGCSGSGTASLTLTLDEEASFGDIVTLSYDVLSGDTVDTSTEHNPLSSFTETVSNNVTDPGDTTPPTATITSPAGATTSNYPVPVTFTFSEDVTGFTEGDVSLTNATAGEFTQVNASTYTVNLYPSTDPATVTVSIASNIAQDSAGNGNSAAEEFTIDYEGSLLTLVITSTVSSATNTSPVPITVTFSEEVTGFTVDDLSVGNGSAADFSTVDDTVFTVNIIPDADGEVTVDVAAGAASDALTDMKSSETAARFSIEYDTELPEAADVGMTGTPAGGYTTDSPVTISLTGDGLASYQYKLDDDTDWNGPADIENDIIVTGDGLHTVEVIVQDEAGNWQDEDSPVRVTFMIGTPDGSEDYPYLITNVTELQAMNSNLSAHYAQINDIDASVTSTWDDGDGGDADGFVPVGNWTTAFTGSFNGNGYTISGLYIYRPAENYVGLFGCTGGATMQNVVLTGLSVTGNIQVGGFVGRFNAGDTVSYITAYGSVNGVRFIGGLIGYIIDGGSVFYCESVVNVTGNDGIIGGLIGGCEEANVIYCTSSGNVNSSEGSSVLGGLIGFSNGSTIQYCSSTGDVTGNTGTGGLLGECYNYTTLSDSFSTSDVSGNSETIGSGYIGGLVGFNNMTSTITRCYSMGNVSNQMNYIGGIAGYNANASTIENSYSFCNLSGNQYVSGIVPYFIAGTVNCCYFAGTITAVSNDAALVAYYNGGTIAALYWDTTTSGMTDGVSNIDPDPAGVTGYPTEAAGDDNDMTDQGIYSGWDFITVWAIDSMGVINSGYPYLRDNPPQ